MQELYQAERSLIQAHVGNYQAYGSGKHFLTTAHDQQAIEHCALIDLTHLSRVGFRGQDSANYLKELGFQLPEKANFSIQQENGTLVARLSATEYLILGGLSDFGESVAQLEAHWSMTEKQIFLLPRQDSHAWLQLTGIHIAQVMAKFCAVDLNAASFLPGHVVQTSIARINAIIVNVSDEYTPKFNILYDRAAAVYLWDVLVDAIREFDGQVVGVNALIS